MHFCPFCASLLVTEQGQQVQLVCPACVHCYRLQKALSVAVDCDVKLQETIMGDEDPFKYANKCTISCEVCKNNQAAFMELQTRSADEPATIFYECTKCGFRWKD
ncbi:DNA-directed RNA polymerase III subunit RPC11 [Pancytospora philotis]|nr:DNA-directed RNA polymerase III subunit RPC11 [Pancytospora philotis]